MEKYQFDFSEEYILENHNIRISPLELLHIDELAKVANEFEIWTYFLDKGYGDLWSEYVQEAIYNRQNRKEYPFVIFDKQSSKYAGMTRLYDIHLGIGVVKMGHTWFGKEFWGTKLNKQCKFLMFEFVFESLKMERIGFGVHGQNLRSIYALKSIGCIKEGVLRNFLTRIDGDGRIDLILFSLLKSEWKLEVKEIIKRKLV